MKMEVHVEEKVGRARRDECFLFPGKLAECFMAHRGIREGHCSSDVSLCFDIEGRRESSVVPNTRYIYICMHACMHACIYGHKLKQQRSRKKCTVFARKAFPYAVLCTLQRCVNGPKDM